MTEATKKATFVERFGTLIDVTDRESAKGPYITFKMQGTKKDDSPFDVYGSCFNADIIAQMKAAVGKAIWTKGPIESFGTGKTSYKVVYFKLSTPKVAEEAANESVPA